MIRRSTAIGSAALVLSLMVHFFGVAATVSNVSPPEPAVPRVEQVSLGEAFEDLAEDETEPVEAEPAEAPPPPVEPPPEPERAEAPTSRALVASPDPRPVPSPDRGLAAPVEPSVSPPVTPDARDTQEPEVDIPVESKDLSTPDARIASPEVSETVDVSSLGEPLGETAAVPPVAPAIGSPVESTSLPTSPVTEPAPPVSEPSLPDVVAALPPEAAPSEAPIPPVSPELQTPEAGAPENDAISSLRPQLRPPALSPRPFGAPDGSEDQTDDPIAPSDFIESPLAAYQRDGTNLFSGPRGGSQSRSSVFSGALGPGNSDVTNYAGEVLMHLNRVPPIVVAARGWARVVFRINPDGSLASVDIIDGSGSSDIERAAKAQIWEGVPFPRPPGGQSRLLTFIYRIQ